MGFNSGFKGLNRLGCQFSRLLAGELCTSACRVCAAGASLCSAVMWRLLATHSILLFPLHFSSRASPCAITFQLDSALPCSCVIVCNRCTSTWSCRLEHSSNQDVPVQQSRLARSDSNTVVTTVLLLDEITWTVADLQRNAERKAPKTGQILYS